MGVVHLDPLVTGFLEPVTSGPSRSSSTKAVVRQVQPAYGVCVVCLRGGGDGTDTGDDVTYGFIFIVNENEWIWLPSTWRRFPTPPKLTDPHVSLVTKTYNLDVIN